MMSRSRACTSCGGILLGRRTKFCSSCAPRRSKSDPRYGSQHWKRTVLAVKRRDYYRCQHCGTTERLVVDHKTVTVTIGGVAKAIAILSVLVSMLLFVWLSIPNGSLTVTD